MSPDRDEIQGAQSYLNRAFLLLLDRTHGSQSIVEARRLLRPCQTPDAMEKAEKNFALMLAEWRRFGDRKAACETLEAAVLLIRCAIMAEWHAAADLLDQDTTKTGADLDDARLALMQRCAGFRWLSRKSSVSP